MLRVNTILIGAISLLIVGCMPIGGQLQPSAKLEVQKGVILACSELDREQSFGFNNNMAMFFLDGHSCGVFPTNAGKYFHGFRNKDDSVISSSYTVRTNEITYIGTFGRGADKWYIKSDEDYAKLYLNSFPNIKNLKFNNQVNVTN